MKKTLSIVIFLLMSVTGLFAQLPTVTFTQWPSASATFTYPLLVTNCGDNREFVVQRNGIIKIVDSLGNILATPFIDIGNLTDYGNYNEEGLLGLAFDPHYKSNGYFYVNYTGSDNNPGPTHIVRYSVSATDTNIANPASAFELLTFSQPYVNHNGGNLTFGPDGYLYDGQGDGGSGGDPGNRAQNKKQYLGKILRIDPNGGTPYAIPPSNPFANDTANYYPEIWDLGMRNPWRFNFDRITGDLWIGDVGQNLYEEVDFEPAGFTGGNNDGWHCREGLHSYTAGAGDCNGTVGLTDPIYEYGHVGGACSISGGYVYRGTQYHDLWGRYLYTDYCKGALWSITPNGSGGWHNDTLGQFTANTYSSFGQDTYGEMYVCAHNSNKVYKISSADCKPVAYILQQDGSGICEGSPLHALYGIGLTYQWQTNNSDISGATSSDYLPLASGGYRVIVTKGACSDTSVVSNITINPLPTVSFPTPISGVTVLCSNNPADINLIGLPSGGMFSGAGVAGAACNVFGFASGTDTITYVYTDVNGCSNSITNYYPVQVCEGVPFVNTVSDVTVFPSPNHGDFNLSIHSVKSQNLVLEIYNAFGQLQLQKPISLAKGKSDEKIHLSNVAPGVYRYTLKGNEALDNGSFIVE